MYGNNGTRETVFCLEKKKAIKGVALKAYVYSFLTQEFSKSNALNL